MRLRFQIAIVCFCCMLLMQDFANGWWSSGRRRRYVRWGSTRRRRSVSSVKRFSTICGSNSIRGTDGCGSGRYGASRGGRSHRGIDIVCSAGNTVYAPFPGKIIRNVRPYGNGKPHDIGVLIHGTGTWQGYSVKMFYVRKWYSRGTSVSGGTGIGRMVNMARQYRCSPMTNHVHVQLYKNGYIINPTRYL